MTSESGRHTTTQDSEDAILDLEKNDKIETIDQSFDDFDNTFAEALQHEQAMGETESVFFDQLQESATETVQNLSGITQETFEQGAVLTSQVFSGLASVIGSCGVFCMHGLGSMGGSMAGNGMGLGGMTGAGANINFSHSGDQLTLSGSRSAIANRAGIPLNELGNYTAEDIISRILETMQCFGECVNSMSFGIIDTLADSFFGLLPNNT
ncbi:MAG: hypothetical protein WDZ94_03615 [Patescibacteria group bacterium]